MKEKSYIQGLRPEGVLYERRQTVEELERDIKKIEDRNAKFGS
jgi:hypothetical protein